MEKLEQDILALLDKISEEADTGIDPREDISPTSTYYILKDARTIARANERRALIDDECVSSMSTEWQLILDNVPESLKNDCKDLEFCTWYIEALCRKYGFKGLTFGFTLATRLIELFWPTIYPTATDGDLSERIAPIIGLNGIESEGALIVPIKAIPITVGETEFSTWQYEQACQVDRLDADKQAKRFSAGVSSLEHIEQSIKATPNNFYIELNDDIEKCQEAYQVLSDAMDFAMGEAQPTSYIRKALVSCQISVKQIAKEILDAHQQQISSHSVEEDVEQTERCSKTVKPVNCDINSREQALKQLDEIASFFRKTEPHSPMSYAIKQVVRWSELSLPELLQELIVDGDARNGFFKLSGIKIES